MPNYRPLKYVNYTATIYRYRERAQVPEFINCLKYSDKKTGAAYDVFQGGEIELLRIFYPHRPDKNPPSPLKFFLQGIR